MNTHYGLSLQTPRTGMYTQNTNQNTTNQNINEKLRNVNKPVQQKQAVSVLESAQNYANELRTQRQNNSATALKLKKLKYQYKNLSSRIISSKTSQAARQAAGQARREMLRLKREKQNNSEDSTDIDAAILHAKAMERIAKKKARHLEEEELCKTTGGPCTDREIEEEKEYDTEDFSEEAFEELSDEELADLSEEELSELLSEFSEEMQEMMAELGLEELTDAFMVNMEDMDPADLTELKTKHRTKEMKDIVKADMMYLKAVFDSLEKAERSEAVPVESVAPQASPIVQAVAVSGAPQQSTINIIL